MICQFYFQICGSKPFKISRIQKEFLPKHLNRNDTAWLPLSLAHCGRGSPREAAGGKEQSRRKGAGFSALHSRTLSLATIVRNGEKINKSRSGQEGMIRSRKLVLGFNSESSYCERKISERTAPGSAWESRS